MRPDRRGGSERDGGRDVGERVRASADGGGAPRLSPLRSRSDWTFRGAGTPGGIRTHDLRLRRPTLYPAELRAPVGRSTGAHACRLAPRCRTAQSIATAIVAARTRGCLAVQATRPPFPGSDLQPRQPSVCRARPQPRRIRLPPRRIRTSTCRLHRCAEPGGGVSAPGMAGFPRWAQGSGPTILRLARRGHAGLVLAAQARCCPRSSRIS
jgi:hypothetical protein